MWAELEVEELVRQILATVQPSPNQGHLGRPYLTAYQLAIELTNRHGDIVERIGLPLGGQGTGQHTSLAQYLARQLSQRISTGALQDIEGAVLADQQLRRLEFSGGVVSTGTGSFNISMFRLK